MIPGWGTKIPHVTGHGQKIKKKTTNYWLKKIFFKIKNASSVAKGDVTRFDTQLWSQRLSVLSLTVVSLSHRESVLQGTGEG